jgi:hypothetical protein
MERLLISLAIGVAAGVIDVTPMIIRKIDKYACVSAFVQWVVLGVIISYVQMPVAPWLKGIAVAVMSVLPILVHVSRDGRKSIIPILIFTIVLGAGVGFATSRLAGPEDTTKQEIRPNTIGPNSSNVYS